MASLLPGFERLPVPTVLLLHELPDGSSHIDWMMARDPEGLEPLVSFRLAQRIDEIEPNERIAAERIADHRPAYLNYEGQVSDDRGQVTRLRRGEVIASQRANDGIHLTIVWLDEHDHSLQHDLQLATSDSEQHVSITCIGKRTTNDRPLATTKEES